MPSIPGLASLAGLFNVMGNGLNVGGNNLPMQRDPGMLRGGNVASMGANPSMSFGGNPSGMPTLPTSEDYNAEPDLTRANELEKAAYEMKPTEVRSNIGTKDILALLFAGLAGSEGGNVLQGYMQGKQAAQAQREALAAQEYQRAQQQKLQEAASIRAGIPIKQSRIAKRNEEKLKQFQTQADIYNKGQSDLTKRDLAGDTDETKRYLADLASQDRRLKANSDLLMKVPVEGRADWARNRLGITDQKLLDSLPYLTPGDKQKVAAANNLKAKTDTIVALRPGQIKNLDNRNAYLASQSGLTDKKAITEVARATVLLPAEAALKFADAKAKVMNANTALKRVNDVIVKQGADRNSKRYQDAVGIAKTSLIAADKAISTATSYVTRARTEAGIVNHDTNATPAQKQLANQALENANTYLNTVIANKDRYQQQLDQLQTMGGVIDPSVTPYVPGMPNAFGTGPIGKIGVTDLGIPPAPGKADVSMGTGIPYKTKSKPAAPPKGKPGKIPSGFKRIQ